MHLAVSTVTTPLRSRVEQPLVRRRAVDLMRRGVTACPAA